MCYIYVLLFLWLPSIGFANPAVNPGQLTAEESANLKKTCGRPPVEIDNVTTRARRAVRSFVVDRTAAPWLVSLGGCSASLISPRHVLTAAHCLSSNLNKVNNVASFWFSCTDANKCGKPIFTIPVDHAYSSFSYVELRGSRMVYEKSDIAIFVLRHDVPISNEIYPACIAEYPVAVENETLSFFGYGKGEHTGYAQEFYGVRSPLYVELDVANVVGSGNTTNAHGWNGDSGGGIVHTRDGVSSVYGVEFSHYGHDTYFVRVATHLFWISKITGIDIKTEDDEEFPFYYSLLVNDHKNGATFKTGARNPQ